MGRRRGRTPISALFLNVHGLRTALLEPSLLSNLNHSILFFSETWVHSSTGPSIPNMDFFEVLATKPPGRGRPSGGLQLYCHPRFNSKLLSSTPSLIAVSLPHISVLGCYFKPTTDFDDLVLSLASALSLCPPDLPILIGGDFNLRPDSVQFKDLSYFLAHYGISLLSDPSTPTYLYSQGSSCIDHVFASRSLQSPSVKVQDISCSDHLPLQTKFSVPRLTKLTTKQACPPARIDIPSAATALSNLDPESPVPSLISEVDKIFASSTTVPRRGRKARSRTWFKECCYALRRQCGEWKHLSQGNPMYLSDYVIARKAYHHHIRFEKEQSNRAERDQLVADAMEKGLPALFRKAKSRQTDGSGVSIADLYRYIQRIFLRVTIQRRISSLPLRLVTTNLMSSSLLSTPLRSRPAYLP